MRVDFTTCLQSRAVPAGGEGLVLKPGFASSLLGQAGSSDGDCVLARRSDDGKLGPDCVTRAATTLRTMFAQKPHDMVTPEALDTAGFVLLRPQTPWENRSAFTVDPAECTVLPVTARLGGSLLNPVKLDALFFRDYEKDPSSQIEASVGRRAGLSELAILALAGQLR